MEKTEIAKYTVTIYDDGSADIVPITERTVTMTHCSSSIRQIVGILEYVNKEWKKKPEVSIHYYVTAGVNTVAAEERINSRSVHSKITRKLRLTMKEFKELVKVCLESGVPDEDPFVIRLRELYNEQIGDEKYSDKPKNRPKKGDKDAIEQLIEVLRQN